MSRTSQRAARLNVTAVVQRAGISRSQIYKWLRNVQTSVTPEDFTRLALALSRDPRQNARLLEAHLQDDCFGPGRELIDTLIAIVSVIRPGAVNAGKKLSFTRRYQGLEPVTCPHPSLEPVLKDTFGLVVYEEHILQICMCWSRTGWD